MRATRVVGARGAVLMAVVLLASACGTGGAPSAAGGSSASSGAAALMAKLASDGDDGLFDARYVAEVGVDAILFVGTKDGAAIGYLCDPVSGARWLTGTADGGRLDLADAKGGHLNGMVEASNLKATLSGLEGYDGDVTLAPAGDDTLLVRQAQPGAGEVVGGLVLSKGTIRGVFSVNATTAVQPVGSAGRATSFAIGLKVSTATLDVTISTSPELTSAQQSKLQEHLQDLRKKLEGGFGGAPPGAGVLATIVAVTVAVSTMVIACSATPACSGTMSEAAIQEIFDIVTAANTTTIDLTSGAFLSAALLSIGQKVSFTSVLPSPSASGSPRLTLGKVTFTTFTGKL